MASIRAVIDVGTNSVKLLVGTVTSFGVTPLHESSRQTRLGQGFYDSNLLQAPAIRETARTVAEFSDTARRFGALSVKVIATSAARDALNRQELLIAIQHASGMAVDIISGEQEAEWAYKGVTSDPNLNERPLLVMDVGGGSTEFIAGHGERLFAESFPIGSVRFLEQFMVSDPPTVAERSRFESAIDTVLREQVCTRLQPVLSRMAPAAQLVGTGGTSTMLARIRLQQVAFDRDEIEQTNLSHTELRRQADHLWSLPLHARRNIAGLPPDRADVILPGVLIFERVMSLLGFASLKVSTRGIRFAALISSS